MPPTKGELFWGKPTSTVDWCELNYEVSPFIVEFWNTLSSVPGMVIPPLFGIFEIWRLGLEKKFILPYIFFLMVGLGSTAFHMTLLYPMQLLDEFPMMWATMVFMYQFSEIRKPARTQVNWKLLGFCVFYCSFFPITYLVLKNPTIMQTAYGLNIFYIYYKDIRFIKHDKYQCSSCNKLVVATIFSYMFAFFLWNVDNQLCYKITDIRAQLPAELAPLTQLHAWWHIFAGLGTYLQMMFIIHARGHFFKPKLDITFTYLGLSIKPVKED